MKSISFSFLFLLLIFKISYSGERCHTLSRDFLIKKDTLKKYILDTVDVGSKYVKIDIDSSKKNHFRTAYDLLKENPEFRFEDDKIYYQGNLLTMIKINGQVFDLISPVGLLRMFPSGILSSFNLEPYTDPLNKFWGNENRGINSIDLRTSSGRITGLLGNIATKYNFKSKYDFSGNTMYFRNNSTTLFDLNVNNNAWNWGADIDENLNKVLNNKTTVHNTIKFKNGDLALKAGFNHNNKLSKDYYTDSLVVLEDSKNYTNIEREQKNFNRSFNINSTWNQVFDRFYFDVTLGIQKDNFKFRNSNKSNIANDFLSNDSSTVQGYNGRINVGYKLYKNKVFLVSSASIGQNKAVNENNYQNDSIYNRVFNRINNGFVQSRVSLKFNLNKVFLGDLYYNVNLSKAVSLNKINSAGIKGSEQKNEIQNIGTTFRWSKPNIDLNTNIYYEKSSNRFESGSYQKSAYRNHGVLYNSSLVIRSLKSRLSNTATFGKVVIYPTLSQRDPANVTLSDNYSSIGNPDLKNQSVFNFSWNANYQMKNADNLNLSYSTSLNRNKIIENLSLLKNDTTISGVNFIKGIRLLSYANSENASSQNSNFAFTYVKNKFFIPNLSFQNVISYSTSVTDRYIDNENFADKSAIYGANINTFYYRDSFSANILYNLSLSNNRFTSIEIPQISSTFRTLSQTISTTARLNYFAFFNLEVSNSYNIINSAGISFENNRTDVTLSQKYFKGKIETSLNIFDLFNHMRQNRVLKNDFLLRRESKTDLIGRYLLLNIAYKFQNLKL
ncbi:hypothetical protein [uncultured Sphingobacterium sp.]|uniref:hypothetical protein n=1 Tax=uncultured Sphingobacterium sp. TaxID=182688 RepID=UPI0025CBD10B|nr:hypothetical protein [uncultured Sphingobacterium sp.]